MCQTRSSSKGRNVANRHLVIAGTGRAGTSLLVAMLDELGFDTGRDRLRYHREAHAGWEVRLPDPKAPYVVKDPTVSIRRLVEAGHVEPQCIDALVIATRDLRQAALSRKRLSATTWLRDIPGGLTGTRNPWRQESILARRVHALVADAAEWEIPVVLLSYPRFAQDPAYAYRRLGDLAGCGWDAFSAAWRTVVDPSLVRTEQLDGSLWLDLKLATKGLVLSARRIVRRVTRSRALRGPRTAQG